MVCETIGSLVFGRQWRMRMFDDGENVIGLLLLGLCAVVGGVLVWQIVTGERLEYNGPGWLVGLLAILFIGGSVYGLVRGGGLGRFGGGRGRQWPDPRTGQTGQRSWWRRLFGRGDGRDGQP
jgi:hypothetical protein